jgi:hypothetical protein
MIWRRFSRPLLFGLLALMLGVSVLYSRAIRKATLTDELQYIPKENTLLLATGEIEALWQAIERHFGEVIREKEHKRPLASVVEELRKHFNNQRVPVNDVRDLSDYGLDLKRGALLSLYTGTDDPGFVLLLHLQRKESFISFLTSLMDLSSEEPPLELRGGEKDRFAVTVLRAGENDSFYLAHPQAGLALISNSLELLRRSLFNRKSNLAFALESDGLYEAVRQHLSRPLLSGPALFLWWQPKFFPPLRQVIGVANLDTDAIQLEAELELVSGGIRVLANLLEQSPSEVSWQYNFSRETAAVFVLKDQAIPQYLRFISTFGDIDRAMQEGYGGIFAELRRSSNLQQMVLAITGYHAGLPEMILGIWGNPKILSKLITDLQIRFRDKRDRAILRGALEAFSSAQEGRPDLMPAVAVLRELELIGEEPDSLFERYPITDGEVRSADLQREDFHNPTYRRQYQRWTIDYIAPRITENDLRYRPELKDKDRETLLNDQFRWASVLLDGGLWVATDAQNLETLLDRAPGESDSLPQSPIFRAATSNRSGKKVQIFLNMDRIITVGLLSPESWIDDIVKRYLLELRNHPAVSLDVAPVNGGNRVRLSVRMLRWSGVESW